MQGMIPHHAQAVKMANWAPKYGESKTLKVLCERIVVGQGDEIKLMQQWLADRGQDVPAADSMRHKMKMGDMVHEMLMPGMPPTRRWRRSQARAVGSPVPIGMIAPPG
jgi:uncharacterized protein (DUF305 family)